MIGALTLLSIGLALLIASAHREKRLLVLLLCAACGYVGAAAVNFAFGPIVGYQGDWIGTSGYEGLAGIAERIHFHGFAAALSSVPLGRSFYGWLVGLLYLLLGKHIAVALVPSILMGLATVLCAYRLASLLWSEERMALTVAVLVAVFPTVVTFSITPGRDAVAIWGVTYGILQFCQWLVAPRAKRIVSMTAAMSLAGVLHTGVTILLLVLLGAIAWESWRKSNRSGAKEILAVAVTTAVVVGAAIAILRSPALFVKIGGNIKNLAALEVIESVTTKLDSYQRTSYLPPKSVVVNSYTDVVTAMPRRVVLFLFTPFPQMVRSAPDIIGFVVALFMAIISAAMVWRGRLLARFSAMRYIGLAFVVFTLVYAWGTVNYGTGTRHKTKMVPVLAAAFLPLVLRPRTTAAQLRQ
jgi:hypothetical protein